MSRYFPTFEKLWNAVKGIVQNRYEAAITTWGNRRWIFSGYQDARFDVNTATSMEICRKHKDLISNVGFIQKIKKLCIQFSVGFDGLVPIPNASDPVMPKAEIQAINESYARSFNNWWKSPELGSNLSGRELTIQWEGLNFDVGNVIIHKTYGMENGRLVPKIQTIDRLRLQTPPQFSKEEGKTICDGIRLTTITVKVRDSKGKIVEKEIITGKPKSYFIRDEFDLQSFQEIPAEQIIHKFTAISPGQLVGIPKGFSVINKTIDYTDLHIIEMMAQKEAAQPSVVETNTNGELSALAARRVPLTIQSTNAEGVTTTKTAPGFYTVSRGQSKFAIKHGDKLENFQVKRPDPCQQNYWDLIRSEICQGYNVPKLLVEPFSLQGTVTRADLEVSRGAFREDFEIISSVVREIYEWYIKWAVKYDPSLDSKVPADFTSCTIMPPPPPNVDIGYTAEQLAKELEIGIKTFQRACAERNLDWREVMDENAQASAHAQEVARKYSTEGIVVTPEDCFFKRFNNPPVSKEETEAETKKEPVAA